MLLALYFKIFNIRLHHIIFVLSSRCISYQLVSVQCKVHEKFLYFLDLSQRRIFFNHLLNGLRPMFSFPSIPLSFGLATVLSVRNERQKSIRLSFFLALSQRMVSLTMLSMDSDQCVMKLNKCNKYLIKQISRISLCIGYRFEREDLWR